MFSILLLIVVAGFVLSFRAAGTSWVALLRRALAWASVGGITGFVLGFFGPMVFAPQANQGPMLGIFLTGPAGFLLGLIGGVVYELRMRRRPVQP